MKHLVDLEAHIDPIVDLLLERIGEAIEHAEYAKDEDGVANILLNELMSHFAADAIGKLAVGPKGFQSCRPFFVYHSRHSLEKASAF